MCRNGIRYVASRRPPAQYDRQQDDDEGEYVEPHAEKQRSGEFFIEIAPIDDLHDHEWQDEEQTDESR